MEDTATFALPTVPTMTGNCWYGEKEGLDSTVLHIMKSLIFAFVLGCSCTVIALQEQENVPSVGKMDGLSFALDLSQSVSESSFACIREYGYTLVFLRCYSPDGEGQVDIAAVFNIQNADSVGLGTEVYMRPQPNSEKTGAQQLDEAYNYLTISGIRIVTVWIQVTSPINWSTNIARNVDFINSIAARAKEYGLRVGIYTNYYDWSQITNGAVLGNTMLWYWNVYGSGVPGESQPTFKDFRPFAGWSAPAVKQFAQVEYVCGVAVNRDVYPTSSLMTLAGVAEFAKTKQIVVGVLGLRNTTSVR
ncbi:hypothetical protein KIN20_034344 [Parelaphostrongylus tenuis]|uniref:Lysozyme n=1 Tax=Parelaphostrongylus tenuis TaxID=148309 RepID=A0AAD5WIY4_PARTN|nr:hypothetical protein KIN20_034344 [Parelaphostrongylus tenuis]